MCISTRKTKLFGAFSLVHVLLLAVVLDSHDLKSIPRHLEFGIWDEEFISGTSLWRGGRGVDENRFGTVRQENKMCRIKHLLKLFFFLFFFTYIRLPN